MALNFYLKPNALTNHIGAHTARVLSSRVLNNDAIILEMLRRGTTYTEADITGVLKLLFVVITDELAEGNTVNLPLVKIRPGISGSFNSVTDIFDPARHSGHASVTPGTMLAKKMAATTGSKVDGPITCPAPDCFYDVSSGTIDSRLTPGRIGRLTGRRLKFDPANANEGIFFIDSTSAATKVNEIDSITELKLVFTIPETLMSGTYTIEVRRTYGSATKVIRTGEFDSTLTVP